MGGRFVSETLSAALDELTQTYAKLRQDPEFLAAFDKALAHCALAAHRLCILPNA